MAMKLQQLRYVWEVARHGLNISAAAESLYTSQPGVSKQIRLLEDELGIRIFSRSGKHLTGITPFGKTIVEVSGRILGEADNIKRAAQEFRNDKHGTLAIAATHMQARYALPSVIVEFQRRFPDVALHIHQGSPLQVVEFASSGRVDFAIAAEELEIFEDLVMLPCYRWNRAVLLPRNHPLVDVEPLTIEELARHPLVTHVSGITGKSLLNDAFSARGLTANIICTATDADIIKTYVRLGLGIGILARMAYDARQDNDLCARDASHLFTPGMTRLALSRHLFLRGYMYEFMALIAPHLTADRVNKALETQEPSKIAAMFQELELPMV
jgi:LysR family cys regulon transcriptional activator